MDMLAKEEISFTINLLKHTFETEKFYAHINEHRHLENWRNYEKNIISLSNTVSDYGCMPTEK